MRTRRPTHLRSLTDALNTLAGVDVTPEVRTSGSPQTISLHGHDESQDCRWTLDASVSAPGRRQPARINTDLFAGASASFGRRRVRSAAASTSPRCSRRKRGKNASAPPMGRAIINWFDRRNRLDREARHRGADTKRGGNNPLTFQDYLDQSGLTYPHAARRRAPATSSSCVMALPTIRRSP